MCDLIIDAGSETNCVSAQLVQDLSLQTQNHPNPYKLRWLDSKVEGFVKKQCLINFSIGSYHDEVLCDVLNMNACHILLGRPWQHDRHSMHDGFTNIYTIKHNGKIKDLIPLHPCKIITTTTKQNHTSCVQKKSKGKKAPVHLFTKKTRESQVQQQYQPLKPLNSELPNTISLDEINISKRNLENSSTYCDVSGFYFIKDTIIDFAFCCRYLTDNQKRLQPEAELGTNNIKKTKQRNITINKNNKREKLHMNPLHRYDISRTSTVNNTRKHEDNTELGTILLEGGGNDPKLDHDSDNPQVKANQGECMTKGECMADANASGNNGDDNIGNTDQEQDSVPYLPSTPNTHED